VRPRLFSKIQGVSDGEPIRLSAHQQLEHAELLERLRAMAATLEDARSRGKRDDLSKTAREMARRRCGIFPRRLLEEAQSLPVGAAPRWIYWGRPGVVRIVYPPSTKGGPDRYLDLLESGQ
jgi:hypothetical protein